MARKDPHRPTARSERLAAHYETCLAEFEAGLTEQPLAERVKALLVLARLSVAISAAETAGLRTEAARRRAAIEQRREDAAVAKAERLLGAGAPDFHTGFNTGEGDEMDMDDQQGGEDGVGDLEQVRQFIDQRLDELAGRFEASGILEEVIAYGDTGVRGVMAVLPEHQPAAA